MSKAELQRAVVIAAQVYKYASDRYALATDPKTRRPGMDVATMFDELAEAEQALFKAVAELGRPTAQKGRSPPAQSRTRRRVHTIQPRLAGLN